MFWWASFFSTIFWIFTAIKFDWAFRPSRRRCTDPFCAVVFVVFLFGMWHLAQHGTANSAHRQTQAGSTNISLYIITDMILYFRLSGNLCRKVSAVSEFPVSVVIQEHQETIALFYSKYSGLSTGVSFVSMVLTDPLKTWGLFSTTLWEKGTSPSCPLAAADQTSMCRPFSA